MFTKRKDELVFQRTVRALQKHAGTIVALAVLAAAVSTLWYFTIWQFDEHIPRDDADISLVGVFAFTSITWVMLATELFRFVLAQNAKMVLAAKHGDRDTLVDLRDDHIYLLIPFVLIAIALIIEGLMMSMPYRSGFGGAVDIGVITFIFLAYGRLIYELEDPAESGWVRYQMQKHCPDVLEIDVEEEFARRWKKDVPRSNTSQKM
jgi:hypothetical protein